MRAGNRQRFLRNSEQRDGGLGGELQLGVRIMFGPLQTESSARMFQFPAERRKQADIVEQGRSEFLDDSALDVDGRPQRVAHSCEPAAGDGGRDMLLSTAEVHDSG